MVSADTARTVVGIIGNVISFFLFTSPVPTFVGIWKKGSVEQFSAVPYLATLLNCLLWTLYGLPMVHPGSILVVTINGGGSILELSYLIIYLIFSDTTKKRLKVFLILVVELILIGLLALLDLTIVHGHSKRSAIAGTFAIVCNIMMYAAPLSIMRLVIKTKSVEFMPLFLSIASFGNGIAWTAYGCIKFDPFITVPNGLGLVLGVGQLILYATYYKSTKRQMAERMRSSKGEQTWQSDSEGVVKGSSDLDSWKVGVKIPSEINGP